MISEFTKDHATRYIANEQFTQAAVYFDDGSHLTFEHSSRADRWARPSSDGTTADAREPCEAKRSEAKRGGVEASPMMKC